MTHSKTRINKNVRNLIIAHIAEELNNYIWRRWRNITIKDVGKISKIIGFAITDIIDDNYDNFYYFQEVNK